MSHVSVAAPAVADSPPLLRGCERRLCVSNRHPDSIRASRRLTSSERRGALSDRRRCRSKFDIFFSPCALLTCVVPLVFLDRYRRGRQDGESFLMIVFRSGSGPARVISLLKSNWRRDDVLCAHLNQIPPPSAVSWCVHLVFIQFSRIDGPGVDYAA